MNSSVFPEFISQETQLPLLEHPSPMSSLGDDGSLNDTDSPRLDDEPSPQIGDLQEPRLSGFADPFVPRPDTLLDVPPLPLPHSSLPSSFPPMYPYSDSYSSTLPFEPELPPPPPPPFASEFGLDSGFASSTTPRDLVPYSSLAPTTTSNTSFPSSDSSVNGVMVKSEKPTKKRGRTSKKGDCKPEQTEEQRREMKRQMRLMRNRLSAQQSRERKKQHVMLLENKMQAIQDSNKQLQQRIQELMEENANLRRKLEVMSDDGNSSDGSASPKRHKLGSDVPSSLSLVRSGTMLFALVFSFALLYSLAGLDMTRFSVARSSTPSTQLARNMPMQHIGRILQSISDEDDEDDKYEFSHDSPPLPLSYEPSHGQQQHSSSSPASAAAYSASPPAKRLSVRVPSSSSQGSHALQTRPSTAVKIHDRERDASADSMVVDLYHQKQNSIHQSLLEAVEMYKKMLIQSNYSLTDGTSIMFCPSAFHIEPRMFGKTETGSVVVRSINGSLPEGASPTESTFDPSKLLVWIPSNAISQRWNGVLNQTFSDTPRKAQPAKGRLSGVTELQVKVTDVRPILEPSTDS